MSDNNEIVAEIKYYQDRSELLRIELENIDSTIVKLKAKLPRLYYLEMNGHYDYEAGITFVGTSDKVYDHVDRVLGLDHDHRGELDKRGTDWAQVYPYNTRYSSNIAGYIKYCNQLDNIWNEVYALSSKEGE